jgi:hypothetical protein
MDTSAKLSGLDAFDKYISAELPDEKKYPLMHRLVCKHMMHGPCGVLNPKCPCMVDGQCRFNSAKLPSRAKMHTLSIGDIRMVTKFVSGTSG